MKRKTSKIPKIRKSWIINPRIRIKESLMKKYKRTKVKKELREITQRISDEPRYKF